MSDLVDWSQPTFSLRCDCFLHSQTLPICLVTLGYPLLLLLLLVLVLVQQRSLVRSFVK